MGRHVKKHIDRVYPPMVQRFREAYYNRIPDGLRLSVRDEFCEVFGYKVHYFHHKVAASNSTTVLEMECKWMEECDAIAIHAKRKAKKAREDRKKQKPVTE